MKSLKKLTALTGTLALFACDGGQATQTAHTDKRLAQIEKRLDSLERGRATPPRRPQRPDPSVVYAVPVYQDDAYRGSQHAKVTIVEAHEFACPYCARLESVLTEVVRGYGKGEVKLVSKQFVVHPQIATLPGLAVCAANKLSRYADYADALWETAWGKDGRLDQSKLSRESLLGLAAELGLDKARFEAALDGAECKGQLNRDRQELARLGVRGTPSLYINGRPYAGPRTAEAIKQAVDQEIAKADQLLAKGGDLEGLYQRLTERGKRAL